MDNEQEKCCALCEYAERTVGEEMICLHRGPIAPTERCRKFRYDPFKRTPPKRVKLPTDTGLSGF